MTALQMKQRTMAGPPGTPRRVLDSFQSMEYKHFTVHPLSPSIGAEIRGLTLADGLTAEEQSELRHALLEWKVLFFRDQPISKEQLVEFGRTWGKLMVPSMTKVGPIPELFELAKGPEARGEENIWHSDQPWQARPPSITILRSVEVPPVGGDTLFSDMAAAYDDLPEDIKAAVDHLEAENVHPVLWGINDYGPAHSLTEEELEERRKQFPPKNHPVIRTHPETGRRAIYVDINHTARICGVDAAESERLMELLCLRAAMPEYQCRFHWENDSIALWDNRSVQHYASSDYWPAVRVMQRMIVEGDSPI
jgi:taurine dioxygenase